MSLSRIRTNLQAQLALTNLKNTNNQVGSIQEKLQTGKRINRAADDSAGYSIASKLRARVGGQAQALRNVGDAKSILNVAEGGLNTINDMLQQMKEKVVQGANDSNGAEERKAIRTELKALSEEIQVTLDETSFNGNKLFTDDAAGTDFTFQVNAEKGDTFDVKVDRLSNKSMELENESTDSIEGKIVGTDLDAANLETTALSSAGASAVEAEFSVEAASVSTNAAGTTADVTFEITVSGMTAGGSFTDTTTLTSVTELTASSSTLELGQVTSNGATLFGGNVSVSLNDVQDSIQEGDKFFVSFDENELNVANNTEAGDSLQVIDSAISEISSTVANLGDAQNRLSFKAENLETAKINNEAARSQIEDADFAFQQVQLAKQQILQQTNVSAVAQANAAPQSVLSLVG
jgi:flagellin